MKEMLAVVLVALAGCSSPATGVAGPSKPSPSSVAAVISEDENAGEVGVAVPGPILFRTATGVSLIEPGGEPREVLASPATHVDWSPDGKKIVFTVETTGGKTEIWTADADGGSRHLLFDCGEECGFADDPAWSPDGRRIVFWVSSATAPSQPLRIVNARSGQLVRDIDLGEGIAPVYPDWAPDGVHLVAEIDYFKKVGDEWVPSYQRLATISTKMAHPRIRAITPRRMSPRQPAWSQNGKWIGFDAGNMDPFSGSGSASNLWKVAPDGTRLTQVTHQGDNEDWVALANWSKTGLLATRISEGSFTLAAVSGSGVIRDLVDGSGDAVAGLRPRIAPGH